MSVVATPMRTEGIVPWVASPLALLTKDERTHRLLDRLASQLEALRQAESTGAKAPLLVLHRSEVDYARARWDDHVLRGEHRLYDLATLLARQLLGTRNLQLAARIIASPRQEKTAQRIVIEETITRDDLKRYTDHTLATRIARRYQYRPSHRDPWGKLIARASFLELRPLEAGSDGAPVTRVLTRVKVDDQIWNKVCDAFFDIDHLVRRDKLLNRASKYIKDVFGLKLLTVQREESYEVGDLLDHMSFSPEDLLELGIPDADQDMELLESKDYLSLPPAEKKKTGWEALKNVYRWCGQVFEVQIQTEANYFLEASDLSSTSHRTFDMQRAALRAELEERVPHYREFRRLLKSLFKAPGRAGAALPDWIRLEP